MSNQCRNCRFWNAEGPPKIPHQVVPDGKSAVFRACRRYPQFLSKAEDDWCGEYQDRAD